MMLFKMSLRNAKRQARDYLVYFVTIILAASLIYAFNGLVFSEEIKTLSASLQSLPWVIVMASIVVVGIIGWLVSYTTNFMLRKRSRELGTYILLGLENGQVSNLFFVENFVVGGIALILGMLLGNLVFQGLRAIILTLFSMPYTFKFTFSLKVVGLTLIYFIAMYLFALSKSGRRIKKLKIYDLLHFDRQNESEILKKNTGRKRTFILSIVFGIIGTILIMLRNLLLGMIGAALIILFLYGFFISFSSGVPDFFDKRPAKKYQKQNLLIFRSLSSKLATMGMVMATIAVLFTATLIAEGSGLVFNALFQSRAEESTCFDLFIASSERSEKHLDIYKEYVDANMNVTSQMQYNIYEGQDDKITQYLSDNEDYWALFERDVLMAESDYMALRNMLDYPPVTLEAGEYIVHCMTYLKNTIEGYSQDLVIGKDILKRGGIYTENFTQTLWDGNGRGFILVVPDYIAKNQQVSHRIYAAMTDVPINSRNGYSDILDIRDQLDTTIDGYDTIMSRGYAKEENAGLSAMIVFPLYYLALVLTMAAATILTIQLLSESGRYRQQYGLLDNLGMERQEMKRALSRQFLIFYTMPALPPLLISVPFIFALGSALDAGVLSGPEQVVGIVAVAVGLFLFIYFTYAITAFTSFKHSVLPNE